MSIFNLIGTVAGIMQQRKAASAQNKVNQQNYELQKEQLADQKDAWRSSLNFQKGEADRTFDLATADRTDMYGNKATYDENEGFGV
jgi:hypothetical protein